MRRDGFKWMGVVALLAMHHVNAADNTCPDGNASDLEKTRILHKLSAAIDQELLVDPIFSSEKSLGSFFCASQFNWDAYGQTKHVSITGFNGLYDIPRRYAAVSVDIYFKSGGGPDHLPSTNIVIPMLDPDLNVAALMQAFGSNYIVGNPYTPDRLPYEHSSELGAAATNPFGNKAISYHFVGKKSQTDIYAVIESDGQLGRLVINQQSKQ